LFFFFDKIGGPQRWVCFSGGKAKSTALNLYIVGPRRPTFFKPTKNSLAPTRELTGRGKKKKQTKKKKKQAVLRELGTSLLSLLDGVE